MTPFNLNYLLKGPNTARWRLDLQHINFGGTQNSVLNTGIKLTWLYVLFFVYIVGFPWLKSSFLEFWHLCQEGYWRVICFFCNVFFRFGYQGNSAFME